MKLPITKQQVILFSVVFLGTGLAFFLYKKGFFGGIETEKKVTSTKEKFYISDEILKKYPLQLIELKEKGIYEEINLPGIVSYDQEKIAHVGSRVSGKIIKVYVKEGDMVSKGSPLASISSAELGSTESAYMKARARLEAVKMQADRAQELYEKKVTSAKEYELAIMDFKTVKADMETSRNALENYGLTESELRSLESGKYNSLNFIIRSPISGTVTDRQAILGQSVSPMDSLFTVADLSTLWVTLEVYEKDMYAVAIGTEAKLYPLGAPDKFFVAKVAHVAEIVDPNKRTAEIRLEFRNNKGKLRPGQTVSAIVPGLISDIATSKVLTLPETAVHKIEGESYVFVQNQDKSFTAKKIKVGNPIDNEIQVLSGASTQDKIVSEGSFLLKSEYLKL